MFVLPSISRVLQFWSVNHTSIYENSEKYKNIKVFDEISSNWSKNLLRANVYKTFESYWATLQCITSTSVISKWGTF